MIKKAIKYLKDRKVFHSIRHKISMAVAINGIIIMILSLWLLSDSMQQVEADLINDRLAADIRLLRDKLGDDGDVTWSERDGALYLGDTLIGDGTAQNLNLMPFIESAEITESFFYTFVRTYNDDQLKDLSGKGSALGHFKRVCGTTTGEDGQSILGTYLEKRVVDKLEKSKDGTYSSVVNLKGRKVFCHYELLKNPQGEVVGIISDGRDTKELSGFINKQKKRGFILSIAAIALLNIALGVIVSAMVSAIKKIKARLKLIGSGKFPEEPLRVNTKDEISDIADSVNDMVKSLKEKDRIETELSLATDIQAHMLPSIFPPFPDHDEFDIFATMDPAKEVGGDFYDFFMLDDKNVAVVIADVSGKGVPAALFMVIAKILIKNHCQAGLSPADVFTKVNQMLCEGNESLLFVTAWLGVLNIETGMLTYVNAGHNPPLIRLSGGQFKQLRTRAGFVLAGMEGIRYRQSQLQMNPGDTLFLYTDGITEATNSQNQLYGTARLEQYLNSHSDDSVQDILSGLRKDIDNFVDGAVQFDDITMLVLNYIKNSEKSGASEWEFEADTSELPAVMGFVEKELENIGCPSKVSSQISVAVEEVFVNIASYAYEGGSGKVKIAMYDKNDCVAIRFADRGMPFDPLAKKDPDITLSSWKGMSADWASLWLKRQWTRSIINTKTVRMC